MLVPCWKWELSRLCRHVEVSMPVDTLEAIKGGFVFAVLVLAVLVRAMTSGLPSIKVALLGLCRRWLTEVLVGCRSIAVMFGFTDAANANCLFEGTEGLIFSTVITGADA